MIEIDILRLGISGDGITSEGQFAARTLPGERISGAPDGKYIHDPRILTPSSDRVSPPCRHFKACGGCQLQHGSDEFVAQWKTDVIRQALAAHGLETTLRPIHTSLPRSRRRAGFAIRRTKKGALAGFHARRSDVIIEIPNCTLLEPDLLACLPALEQLAVAGASRKATLSAFVTTSLAGLDVAVTGGLPLDGPLAAKLAQLCGHLGFARLSWDGEVVATTGAPVQRMGDIDVVPPPGAFLQATSQGEAALTQAVLEILNGAGRVVDLFCGIGTFSLPLARQAEVHAVEAVQEMLQALDLAARHGAGLRPVQTETRDLFQRPLLPDELAAFDGVLIDPPRAGAEAQIEQIVAAQVPVVAYVSCNPVSFARDAAAMVRGGYDLNWVLPVDQFRWSSHVELAAQFRKRAA